MQKSYTVTAIVTTYKRNWNSIERAVKSILAQTYPVSELLIVDDNILYENLTADPGLKLSSPFSRDIKNGIKALNNPLIRYISMEGNYGVSAARNKGIEEAKGELIGFLDDDDEWVPEKIEKQVKMFEEHPDAGLVFSLGLIYYDETKEVKDLWQKNIFKEEPSFQDMLWGDYVGSASHPLIKKEALESVRGFTEDKYKAVEDYLLWIEISKRYPIYGTKEELYIKHMDKGEHVSAIGPRVFSGYVRIFDRFHFWYRNNPVLRERILKNVIRVGIKSKDTRVIPYIFLYAQTVFIVKFNKIFRRKAKRVAK